MGRIQLQTAPEKPAWGAPCNGCGFCCAAEVCVIGQELYGKDQPAPCPGMRFRDGRFWCHAVTLAESAGPSAGLVLRMMLGIGRGCDSEDGNEAVPDNR